MKNILNSLDAKNIISPALLGTEEKNGIGLYPDRAYIKGLIQYKDIESALEDVAHALGINKDYFNVMVVSGEYGNDAQAIKRLNSQLDRLELFNMGTNAASTDKVRRLIKPEYAKELYRDALGKVSFPIDTLGEIAATAFDADPSWSKFQKAIRSDNDKEEIKAYNQLPKEKLKSFHKYICIVQADGDNVGKAVTHTGLTDGQVKKISEALLEFGKSANKTIKEFGGFPIYAGGDDLLFIAPVVGHDNHNIFELLEKLNSESFGSVKDAIDNCHLKVEEGEKAGTEIHASLSFGVSITYYKYPLYEALESARNQLFGKAKKIDGKNAIVVEWRKHSGGAFHMEMSCANVKLKAAFEEIIEVSGVEESVVSAVCHKIRENEGLFKLWTGHPDANLRNHYFFQKYMEYNLDNPDEYKKAALNLFDQLMGIEKDVQELAKTMYAMLRIAKFINGEEVIDE